MNKAKDYMLILLMGTLAAVVLYGAFLIGQGNLAANLTNESRLCTSSGVNVKCEGR